MCFEDLDVWKRRPVGRIATEGSYPAANRPIHPSITSNIGKGYQRDSPADRVQFLTYAKGSCGEVRTQLYIGMEAGILPRDTARAWIEETRQLSAMLYGLIKTMRQKDWTLLGTGHSPLRPHRVFR